jgi:hypothetical protein
VRWTWLPGTPKQADAGRHRQTLGRRGGNQACLPFPFPFFLHGFVHLACHLGTGSVRLKTAHIPGSLASLLLVFIPPTSSSGSLTASKTVQLPVAGWERLVTSPRVAGSSTYVALGRDLWTAGLIGVGLHSASPAALLLQVCRAGCSLPQEPSHTLEECSGWSTTKQFLKPEEGR